MQKMETKDIHPVKPDPEIVRYYTNLVRAKRYEPIDSYKCLQMIKYLIINECTSDECVVMYHKLRLIIISVLKINPDTLDWRW